MTVILLFYHDVNHNLQVVNLVKWAPEGNTAKIKQSHDQTETIRSTFGVYFLDLPNKK